ncbi:hypothetical protein BU15DRAFT_50804, partial [Melanogaster broomeanus]
SMVVMHLDSIARAAHLIGTYGSTLLPGDFSDSLDVFRTFCVNRCADHHTFEFLSH